MDVLRFRRELTESRRPKGRRLKIEQGGVEKDRRTDQERQHATPFPITDIAANPLTIDE